MLNITLSNSLFLISVIVALAALMYTFGGQILKDLKTESKKISNENNNSSERL